MIRNWYSLAGVGVLIVGTVLFFQFSDTSAIERISLSAQEVKIQENIVVTINNIEIPVEIANTFEQRSSGLSFRSSLEKNTGMLFVFENPEPVSFWMYEMNFPLDIIWINNGEIVGIERNVPYPTSDTKTENLPTYPSPGNVGLVLEINANEGSSFIIGDKVEIINTNEI